MSVKVIKDLLKASEDLIEDMRRRSIARQDFEIEEVLVPGGMGATTKKVIPILDCGNSVLFGISEAMNQARDYIERVEVEEKIPEVIDHLKSRNHFEEWIKTRNWFISNGVRLTRSWDGSCYKDNRVQQYWATWQAAIRFTKEN